MNSNKKEKMTLREMASRSHSHNCCCGWKIQQPDGTETRSFKEAADGSTLELQFIYGEEDCPICLEYWDKEYYEKIDGSWYLVG